MEEIEQTPNGTADFGQTASYTISRNGDLVHKMYFNLNQMVVLSRPTGTSDRAVIRSNVGHTLLKEVECEIGGQKIDKHYSHWLATWSQLTELNPTGACSDDSANQTAHAAVTRRATSGTGNRANGLLISNDTTADEGGIHAIGQEPIFRCNPLPDWRLLITMDTDSLQHSTEPAPTTPTLL